MPEQNYGNHTRFDPAHHFVGVPLAALNLIGAIVYLTRGFSWPAVLLTVSSLLLILVLGNLRNYATKLQDRIVRTEENFRHYVLTGKPLDPRLAVGQIVALRFAGDDEFPGLCARAVQEHMKKDEIKRAIRSWRADLFRV